MAKSIVINEIPVNAIIPETHEGPDALILTTIIKSTRMGSPLLYSNLGTFAKHLN